ncbi:MAG: hypothetical protein IPK91_12390 [Saprospiraceae bacterium]|nr:hypothetical protein [Saprospiraceae bacterium]MBK8298050.1 hypothetical protein [Saprospiraceae bacterium]
MSAKKIALYSFLLLTVIYLLLCLLGPSSYKFNNEVRINGPHKIVYLLLNDIKDWSKWFSWKKEDPDLKFTPGNFQYAVGANFSFEGKKMGTGSVIVEESYQDSFITVNLNASKLPSNLKERWQIVSESSKAVYVNLTARLQGEIPFYKRGYYFGLKKQLDEMLTNDLEGMKGYIENLLKDSFGISKTIYPGNHYFGIMNIVQNNKIPSFYAKSYPKIYNFLDSLKIPIIGPPVGLILDWEGSTGQVYILAALPVENKMPNYPAWTSFDIPQMECMKLEHYGSYATLRNAHVKLSYLMDNSPFTLAPPIIEEYVTSPSQQPDTSKWLTNIYYLLDQKGGYSKTLEQKKTLEDQINKEEEERRRKLRDVYR